MSSTPLGIWASSSPAKRSEFKKGISILKKWGIDPQIPPQVEQSACTKLSGGLPFLAGNDNNKVKALEELWTDGKIERIMAVRGGAGSLRLIPYLEKSTFLKRAEKEIWGFSDLTSIQNYLFFRYGYQWVHAPMVTSNALLDANPIELRAWQKCLSGPSSERHNLKILSRAKSGKIRLNGKIFGGNLSCLKALCGSPGDRVISDAKVLFLEEVNEQGYRLDRALNQLSNSNLFASVNTVVLGHLTNCPLHKSVLINWAQRTGVNLLAGLKSGHDRPNLPLQMGVVVRLEQSSQNSAQLELPAPKLK